MVGFYPYTKNYPNLSSSLAKLLKDYRTEYFALLVKNALAAYIPFTPNQNE